MQTLELFDLKGKTALVTGCDTGLGQGMAIALAEAGANIVCFCCLCKTMAFTYHQVHRNII